MVNFWNALNLGPTPQNIRAKHSLNASTLLALFHKHFCDILTNIIDRERLRHSNLHCSFGIVNNCQIKNTIKKNSQKSEMHWHHEYFVQSAHVRFRCISRYWSLLCEQFCSKSIDKRRKRTYKNYKEKQRVSIPSSYYHCGIKLRTLRICMAIGFAVAISATMHVAYLFYTLQQHKYL